MRTLIKILLLIGGTACNVSAQNYAYFYFEGDQETPFYVKVEGQMQERFGQNHFIIPRLDAGYTHFEILFEKKAYPPQKFLLEVPEGGSRGFVLHKVNQRQFALYDLQQHRYIVAGNTKEEDHAPEMGAGHYIQNITSNATDPKGSLPDFSPEATGIPQKRTDGRTTQGSGPDFLTGIELNARGATSEGKVAPAQNAGLTPEEERIERKVKRARHRAAAEDDLTQLPALRYDSSGMKLTSTLTGQKENEQAGERETINIPNTDCPNAMDNNAFENFALKFIEQPDDNKKLRLLRKNHRDLCFSTEQVRIITKNLETQSARYSAVKMLYPQTTDQENYRRLESLFNTPFLKAKFNEIIEH